jgi:hypothetical protein
MDSVPPPPPAAPPKPQKKKGLHPMAWVGIGCGGLLFIAVIGIALAVGWFKRTINEFQEDMAANPERAAAEMIVKFNPDLEMVSDNETAGEMTIRVKSSGEEMTISYADLAEGRLKMKDGEGNAITAGMADVSDIPAWVPQYPRIASQTSLFQQDGPQGVEGVWMFSTRDTPEQVSDFYESNISWSTTGGGSASDLGTAASANYNFSGEGRKLQLTAASQDASGDTQVTITYSEAGP